MRRKVSWDTSTGKLTEQYCYCPRCENAYVRSVGYLGAVQYAPQVDAPAMPKVMTARERRKPILEAEREAALLERRD